MGNTTVFALYNNTLLFTLLSAAKIDLVKGAQVSMRYQRPW